MPLKIGLLWTKHKRAPRKVPASYKSSDAFCGYHFFGLLGSLLNHFNLKLPENHHKIQFNNLLIPIIAKRDVYHVTKDRVTHNHNKVTTPETRCHGSLAAAMVISFNSTGPYSNCFCLRRRHQRTNGTSVEISLFLRMSGWLDESPKLRLLG